MKTQDRCQRASRGEVVGEEAEESPKNAVVEHGRYVPRAGVQPEFVSGKVHLKPFDSGAGEEGKKRNKRRRKELEKDKEIAHVHAQSTVRTDR